MLTPTATETESDFITRFHESMQQQIPDTDKRQQSAVSAWRQSRGPTDEEQRAAEQFPEADYVHVRDVPVFAEHETLGRDGKVSKYGRDELQAIIDRCNLRIADTGDFAALTFGHTPDSADVGAEMPEMAGFAGPFRLGMIGRKNPRWAIFGDEHHYRLKASRVKECPRRSPEVWLGPMADRFFDPIAVLGAEAPRLDMGMRYVRTAGGRVIEKYAATFPGPATVCLPDEPEKEKHAMPDPNADGNPPDTTNQLSPENQALLAALMETKVIKWAAGKMAEEEAAMAGADPDPANPAPTPAPPPAPNPSPSPTPEPEKDKAGMDRYSKMQGELEASKVREQQLQKELDAVKTRVDTSEEKARKVERYSRLEKAGTVAVLDVDEEMKRVEKYDDATFDAHMGVILEKYAKIPVNAGIFVPENVPTGTAQQTEKYRKEASKKAQDYVINERSNGRQVSYEDALAKALAGKL